MQISGFCNKSWVHLKEAKKTVVGASRSRRDRARERDAPTTNLQKWNAP